MDNSPAARSARYRAKDVDAYRKRKAEWARTPEQREKRRLYALKWRHEHLNKKVLTGVEKLLSKTIVSDGCWLWVGRLNDDGYGMMSLSGKQIGAHRASYILHKGAIHDGLEIDHLCRVRNCVNPNHLEAVTHAENVKRGDHSGKTYLGKMQSEKKFCPQGHPYSGDNLVIEGRNKARRCRICNAAKTRRYIERKTKKEIK